MVINGGLVMNVALFLTMLFILTFRLPDYPDDEHRHKRSRLIFIGLLLYHIGFAAVRFVSQNVRCRIRIFQSVFIFVTIYMFSYLCVDWIYRDDRDFSKMDEHERDFEVWINIELLVLYTSVLGAGFYTLLRGTKSLPMIAEPPIKAIGDVDFMETNAMMIELVTLFFTPAFLGSFHTWVFPDEAYFGLTPGSLSNLMIILCWVQVALLCYGLFTTQVSANSYRLLNSIRPSIVRCALFTCMLVMPWIIIGLAIGEMISQGDLVPYLFFVFII